LASHPQQRTSAAAPTGRSSKVERQETAGAAATPSGLILLNQQPPQAQAESSAGGKVRGNPRSEAQSSDTTTTPPPAPWKDAATRIRTEPIPRELICNRPIQDAVQNFEIRCGHSSIRVAVGWSLGCTGVAITPVEDLSGTNGEHTVHC